MRLSKSARQSEESRASIDLMLLVTARIFSVGIMRDICKSVTDDSEAGHHAF
jgi:hypothetical protein